MGSRQLRKLRKQQELLGLQKEAAAAGSDDSENEIVPAEKPRPSVFSSFAALGDMRDDDDDADHQSDENETIPDQAKPVDDVPVKKSKKSKKKKKKGKKPDAPAPEQTSQNEPALDDIDKALEELKLGQKAGPSGVSSSAAADASVDQLRDLLRINFQHLKAMNEMRKLFGKAMGAADSEAAPPEPRNRGAMQQIDLETYLSFQPKGWGRGSKPAMFDSVLRANPFIEGKKTWPKGSALGLKMATMTNNNAEVSEYAYCHDKEYDGLESDFFYQVQMYDPMRLVHFLYRYPYHVSTLIQVSKVAKQDQNSALAADLIERALFSFGRVSLKDFRKKLEDGRVYMDFARPENRQFYLAGWNLIQHLILKGTYRTALEWSKLFLSINHEDPYGMINWVHVLAIRAHQAQWLIELCKTKLLNDEAGLPSSPYVNQTVVLAHLQLGDKTSARSVLISGMESVPWLYCALFSALDIDLPPSLWNQQARNQDDGLHTQLYIHMTKDLWSTPDATALLAEAARAAKRTDTWSLPNGRSSTLGTARFIYLGGNTDLMGYVSRDILSASPNYDFDPLPPKQEDNKFSSPSQSLPWTYSQENDISGLAPFLNHPRVRAAFAERRAALAADGAAGDGEGADEEVDFEEQLATLAREAEAGNVETDRRGFLGRVLDMMMPHLLGTDERLEASAQAAREAMAARPVDWTEALAHLREEEQLDIPGAWSDDIDPWGDDDFEDGDDFDGLDDDDEMPPLVGGGEDEMPPLESVPYQATVEDAEEDEDQLERPQPGRDARR